MNAYWKSAIWITSLILLVEVPTVNSQCEEGKPNVYSAGSGSISSPNYPTPYSANQTCVWQFLEPLDSDFMIVFEIVDIHLFQGGGGIFDPKTCTASLQIQKDTVNCESGAPSCSTYRSSGLCSTKHNADFSSCQNKVKLNSPLEVIFTSDGDIGDGTATGFNMTFLYVDCITERMEYLSGSGNISSPNYPGPYPPSQTYIWDFHKPENGEIVLLFNITDIRLFYGSLFNNKVCTGKLTMQGDEVNCESETPSCYSYRSSSVSSLVHSNMHPDCTLGVIGGSPLQVTFQTEANVDGEEKGFFMLYNFINIDTSESTTMQVDVTTKQTTRYETVTSDSPTSTILDSTTQQTEVFIESTTISYETDSYQTTPHGIASTAKVPIGQSDGNTIMVVGLAVLFAVLIGIGLAVLIIMLRKRSQPRRGEDIFPTRHRGTPSARPLHTEPPPDYDVLYQPHQYEQSNTYESLHSNGNVTDTIYCEVAPLDGQPKITNNNQPCPEYDNLFIYRNQQTNNRQSSTKRDNNQSEYENVSEFHTEPTTDVDASQSNGVYPNNNQSDDGNESLSFNQQQTTSDCEPNIYDTVYESSESIGLENNENGELPRPLEGVDTPTLTIEPSDKDSSCSQQSQRALAVSYAKVVPKSERRKIV
uniref:uncharacterized protein LOC120342231 isoform X2 n=1 Tax=Styela clava TaxID=7725 RepID=UPI0019398E0F|nr:uncharacterized protein LOC120342231 isoform X2 [Styela clava]